MATKKPTAKQVRESKKVLRGLVKDTMTIHKIMTMILRVLREEAIQELKKLGVKPPWGESYVKSTQGSGRTGGRLPGAAKGVKAPARSGKSSRSR